MGGGGSEDDDDDEGRRRTSTTSALTGRVLRFERRRSTGNADRTRRRDGRHLRRERETNDFGEDALLAVEDVVVVVCDETPRAIFAPRKW